MAFKTNESAPMPARRLDVLRRCGVTPSTEWAPYFNEGEHMDTAHSALVDLYACIEALIRRVEELEKSK